MFISQNLWAAIPMATSPKGVLMGNAFTAIADDEYTLFYNPAALGRNKGFTFSPLNFNIIGVDVVTESDRLKNFPKSDPALIAERLLDFPVNLQIGTMPGFKIGSFGFNLIANSKTQVMMRNAIHPVLDLKYNYDQGFITGLAFGFGRGKINSQDERWYKKRFTNGYRVSFGVAFKYIKREGVEDEFDLFGTKLLEKINAGNTSIADFKDAFGFSESKGFGMDLGTEFTLTRGRTNFTMGLAVLDVGDTKFEITKGEGNINNQKMAINTGVALRQDFTLFDVTLSSDIKPINQSKDMMSRFHMGAEVAFPVISIFSGWSEGYVSYGLTARLWPVKVTLGLYGQEMGAHYSHKEARNFVAHVSLFDFSFDL